MFAAARSSDRIFARLAWATLAVGVAGSFAYAVIPSNRIQNLLYYSIGTIALGIGFAGILRRRFPGQRFMVLLLAGVATWLVADWLWWLFELSGYSLPFPSPIDLLYLCGYPLTFVAVVWLWRRHMMGAFGGLLESAILATAFGVLTWAAVIAPAGGREYVSGFAAVTAFTYPLLDAMLLVGLGQLLLVPSLRRTRALQALTLGIALYLSSDALYAFSSLRGIYVDNTWRDTGWMLAYVLWGFAGAHPSLRSLCIGTVQRSPIRRWALRTSLLGLSALSLPIALLIAERRDTAHTTAYLFAGGAFVIVAVSLWIGSLLSAQQRREDELADALAKLQTLIETAPLAIVAVERNRLVTLWNPGAERLFGWQADEVVGKPYPLSTGERTDQNLDLLLSGETLSEESETTRKDGSTVEVAVSSAPLVNPAGGVVGAVILFQDASERRALEEKLRHSQRLEMVGQLAGGVAHDFNNLLTAITGYCSFSLERARGDPELTHNLQEISRASERATELTQQLLAFGRRQVLRPSTFDLNKAVVETNAIIGRVLGENIRIINALDPAGCPVKADQGQIEQVLMNLAVNARDAMPEGGALSFMTENIKLSAAQAESLTLSPGRYARLRVTDTGQGMSSETYEHIFEPFFTTKDVGEGSGLGLATVYGIVSQSGGQITVESEPGWGSNFSIYLPWAELEHSQSSAETDQRPARGRERVLLVEDEPGVREITMKMLEQQGYEVTAAADPKQAIDIASHADFDLLVTDLVLPGMNGQRLSEELRSRKVGLRVVYVSGYPRDGLKVEGLDPDIRFLQKPYSVDELARTIRSVLDSNPLADASSAALPQN
jgi:PAS domain S-box-containing protein